MQRNQAFELLKQNLSNQNLIKHSLATEAMMIALARHFGQDEEKWGLVGLLHDIDYEKVKNDLTKHSLVGAEMLKEAGLPDDICQAVKVHNEGHGILQETLMEKAIYAVDPLSGLIVAATLVLPSKKLADLSAENILNRFGEKAFARGANREIIKKCQALLNLSLEEFVKIGLEAMQGIADQLGL